MSDTELGGLARAGDVQALGVLFERCRPSLYAAALGILGSRADAHDAVQDACVTALLRIGQLRDGGAGRAWLHRVLRNVCLMRIRQYREVPVAEIELPTMVPGPEAAVERHVMREWVWEALESLSTEERATVMLRHFTRCDSYDAIAQITAVPIGTVRSRLNRARARLSDRLRSTVADSPIDRIEFETSQRRTWENFYQTLHEQPVPRTYRELFVNDIDVRDTAGEWHGVKQWSAEEREAISLGVRATVVDVLPSSDITVVEVDFSNPAQAPDHCPPHATFVHRLRNGRSTQLRVHYPAAATCRQLTTASRAR